jgi:hypothetical protein
MTNASKGFRKHHIKDCNSGAAKMRLAKTKTNFQHHTNTRLETDKNENINILT